MDFIRGMLSKRPQGQRGRGDHHMHSANGRSYFQREPEPLPPVECPFCRQQARLTEMVEDDIGFYYHPRCKELRAKRANVLDYSLEEVQELQHLLPHEECMKLMRERGDKELEKMRMEMEEEKKRCKEQEQFLEVQRGSMLQQHQEKLQQIDTKTREKMSGLKQEATREQTAHEKVMKKSKDDHQKEMERMKQEILRLERETEEMTKTYKKKGDEQDTAIEQTKKEQDQLFQEQKIEQEKKFELDMSDLDAELRRNQEEFDRQMERDRIALDEALEQEYIRELVLTKPDGTVLEMREKTPGIVTHIADRLMGD